MHVTSLGAGYYCPGCERYFPNETPTEVEVTAEYTDPGTKIDDLVTRSAYECHDVPPCRYDERTEFQNVPAIYECGDCEGLHEDFADAIACCKEEE